MNNDTITPVAKWLMFLGVIGFIAIITVVSIFNRSTNVSEKVTSDLERDAWPVNVMTVEPQAFTKRIKARGIILPLEEAALSSEISARALTIMADLGDRVEKGQELIRLESSAYALNVEAAKAQVEQAQANDKLSAEHFMRLAKLAEAGHVSQEELDNASASAQGAKAVLNSALASFKMAQRNLNETSIRAPFAGQVSSRSISPGSMVSPGLPIITVVQDETMRLDLALTETDIKLVKVGLPVSIYTPVMPDRVFDGKVTRIGLAAQKSTGSFPVRVEIDNQDLELLSGMRCDAEIKLTTTDGVIVITRDHLVTRDKQDGVFIAQEEDGNQTAKFSVVKIQNTDGENVHIDSGMAAGQLLVVVGQQSLKDGSKLVITEKDGQLVKQEAAAPVPEEAPLPDNQEK